MKLHSSVEISCVGPAVSTGKSSVRCCPGGRSTFRGSWWPKKPREIVTLPLSRNRRSCGRASGRYVTLATTISGLFRPISWFRPNAVKTHSPTERPHGLATWAPRPPASQPRPSCSFTREHVEPRRGPDPSPRGRLRPLPICVDGPYRPASDHSAGHPGRPSTAWPLLLACPGEPRR